MQRNINQLFVTAALPMLEPDYHERLPAAEAEHEAVKNGPDIAAR